MAHGLETRVPFPNLYLVQYISRLHGEVMGKILTPSLVGRTPDMSATIKSL
jgi:hypothetical protein